MSVELQEVILDVHVKDAEKKWTALIKQMQMFIENRNIFADNKCLNPNVISMGAESTTRKTY